MTKLTTRNPHSRAPQRCRNVAAFSRAYLSKRSAYTIQTNQMRLAFARAIGLTF